MTQNQTKLRLIRMSEVETQEVHWLWHPYIPEGKLTIIQGVFFYFVSLILWLHISCVRQEHR